MLIKFLHSEERRWRITLGGRRSPDTDPVGNPQWDLNKAVAASKREYEKTEAFVHEERANIPRERRLKLVSGCASCLQQVLVAD